MSVLKRLFGRMGQDENEARKEMIGKWASSIEGTIRICDAQPRTLVKLAGVVESLRVQPRDGVPSIEAMLSDGSGTVTATWLGRRTVPGLTLGARMVLEGRLGGTRARLQLMNPSFEFVPGPDH